MAHIWEGKLIAVCAAIVIGVVVCAIVRKKRGKGGCDCGCDGCCEHCREHSNKK